MRNAIATLLVVACVPDDTVDDTTTLFSAAEPTEVVAISARGNAVAILETAVVAAEGTTLHVLDLETRRSEETPLQATVTPDTPVVIADDGTLLAWSARDLTLWDGTDATLVASDVEAYDASWDLTRAIVDRNGPAELPVEVYNLTDDTSFLASALGRNPVRACLDSTTASQVSGPDGVVTALTCDVFGNGARSFSWRALGLLNVHGPGYERQIDIGGGSFTSTWLGETFVYVHDEKTHVLELATDTLTSYDVVGVPVAHHEGVLYIRTPELGLVRGDGTEFLPVAGPNAGFAVATATGVALIEELNGVRTVVISNAQSTERIEVDRAQQLHVAGDVVYVLTANGILTDDRLPADISLLRIEGGTAVAVQDELTDVWSNGETVVWGYVQDGQAVLASEGWSESFERSPSAFLVPGGALLTGYREGRFRTFLHR